MPTPKHPKRKCVRKGCEAWAIRGATICEAHGANGKVKRNAAVRAELDDWGLLDRKEDPGEVLLRLISQSARRAAHYATELQALVEEVGLETALKSEIAKKELEERMLCGNFATKGIAAGLKEREVRLAEQQVHFLGDVVQAMLKAMNPTPEQADLAKRAFADQLQLMTGMTGS